MWTILCGTVVPSSVVLIEGLSWKGLCSCSMREVKRLYLRPQSCLLPPAPKQLCQKGLHCILCGRMTQKQTGKGEWWEFWGRNWGRERGESNSNGTPWILSRSYLLQDVQNLFIFPTHFYFSNICYQNGCCMSKKTHRQPASHRLSWLWDCVKVNKPSAYDPCSSSSTGMPTIHPHIGLPASGKNCEHCCMLTSCRQLAQ